MEYINEYHHYRPEDLPNLVHIIVGGCSGVAIKTRGEDDKHLMFEVLMEDDGYVFPGSASWSTGWLNDVLTVLREAETWLMDNAEPDTCEGKFPNGIGWRLKA